MKLISDGVRFTRFAGWLALVVLGVSGCALSQRPPPPALYDFGAGPLATPVSASPQAANGPALALNSVQSVAALDGAAVLYRLAYADAQQLRAYALARWTMPPAQLLQQRLRERLSQQRAVLNPDEGAARVLQIELEEFSQVFDAPGQSKGLLRLRATLLQATPAGDRLVAQRNVIVQRPAPSADAAGGVRALTAATDAAVEEISQWLQQWR
jgi:cholesterol transport system auxiliary component